MKKISEMTYEEFLNYCEEKACNGGWSLEEAIACIDIINEINKIKVKSFGITLKTRTKQAKEKAWQEYLNKGRENNE